MTYTSGMFTDDKCTVDMDSASCTMACSAGGVDVCTGYASFGTCTCKETSGCGYDLTIDTGDAACVAVESTCLGAAGVFAKVETTCASGAATFSTIVALFM